MNIDNSRVEDLIARRTAAERAVEGMPDGPMKEKAFEMVLRRLLDEVDRPATPARRKRGKQVRKPTSDLPTPTSPARSKKAGPRPHLDELLNEGFFDTEHNLPETAAALQKHGHIFEQEALSPHLLRMTRDKVLQRNKRQRDGEKEMWFYNRAN